MEIIKIEGKSGKDFFSIEKITHNEYVLCMTGPRIGNIKIKIDKSSITGLRDFLQGIKIIDTRDIHGPG